MIQLLLYTGACEREILDARRDEIDFNRRSLYEVQKLLGHHDPKVKMRYAHLSPQAMLEAANVVGSVVGRRSMVAASQVETGTVP